MSVLACSRPRWAVAKRLVGKMSAEKLAPSLSCFLTSGGEKTALALSGYRSYRVLILTVHMPVSLMLPILSSTR